MTDFMLNDLFAANKEQLITLLDSSLLPVVYFAIDRREPKRVLMRFTEVSGGIDPLPLYINNYVTPTPDN